MQIDFDSLTVEYRDRIYRLCYSYCDRVEDVQDLFQDVLINIWKSLPGFRGDSSISTWIYRVALNTALMHTRRETNRRSRFTDYQSEVHDRAHDPSGSADNRERLHFAIAQLPPADRVVIALVLEDCSYQEIADVTGLSASHVGVKISRIKEKIMKVLQHEDI